MSAGRGAIAAATVLLAGAAPAAQPAAEPDADFLEFLGSLDAEDEDWREYLAERPEKVAKESGEAKAPAKPAERKTPAPRAGVQQDKVEKP